MANKELNKEDGRSKPRPLFILMQVLDADGNVRTDMTKEQVNIVSCSRNSAEVLDALDGGSYEGVLYKKFLAN